MRRNFDEISAEVSFNQNDDLETKLSKVTAMLEIIINEMAEYRASGKRRIPEE
jgi:hypothetical protein